MTDANYSNKTTPPQMGAEEARAWYKSRVSQTAAVVEAVGADEEAEIEAMFAYARERKRERPVEPKVWGVPTPEQWKRGMDAAKRFNALWEKEEAQEPQVTNTEITEGPDGGVTIRVMFRAGGRDFTCIMWHPCTDGVVEQPCTE